MPQGSGARGKIKLAPSILAADFTRLGRQLSEVERAGADRIHVDVMDGHFVPPITLGPVIVEAVRKATTLPIEAHLMVERPEHVFSDFIGAGANIVIVHQESTAHLHRLIQQIRAQGARAGVALNPATPAGALEEILEEIQLVLVMTVNPGYAGQAFIPRMLDKIQRVRRMIEAKGLSCELEVDGGIGPQTAQKVARAGADVLVAASAIFRSRAGIKAAIRRLLESAEQG